MAKWLIRDERAQDAPAISTLTTAAFDGHPYSNGTEAAIVDGLRAAGALTLSLVADAPDGEILGHVALSPVSMEGDRDAWFGLGPVSVRPGRQKQGVGSALIREGLARLRARGAAGCVVVGDVGYYSRFGFANDRAVSVEGVPPEHVMVLEFGGERPRGTVRFHPVFGV